MCPHYFFEPRPRIGVPLALGLLMFAAAPLPAQFIQQGGKLTASNASGPAGLGPVALSADGNTALVGGPADAAGAGAVWVWTRNGNTWTQTAKLVGTGAVGNARLGVSVALSADGNTAIAGGFLDHSAAGAAWVWVRRNNTNWSQEAKLVGTGATGNAYQGYSVALSGDGNTALVGGYNDAGGIGAVWAWTRTSGTWSQQGNKLVGSGSAGTPYQGYSVALSGDGNTALIGGFLDDSGAGAAWVWTRSGHSWSQDGSKLVGSGATGRAYQGVSVALSSDGDTALVGGFVDNNGDGAVWPWTRSAGMWKQGPKLTGAGAAGHAYQGVSVALSANGNTALAGGFLDEGGKGAAWVWTRNGSGWSHQGSKLVGTGGVGNSGQGRNVALSDDGTTCLIGGAFDNESAGAAWAYVFTVDVSRQVSVSQSDFSPGRAERANAGSTWTAVLTITNTSSADSAGRTDRGSTGGPINGPLHVVFTNLTQNVRLMNGTGVFNGRPYITVAVDTLAPGESVNVPVEFANPTNNPITYTPVIYAGTL